MLSFSANKTMESRRCFSSFNLSNDEYRFLLHLCKTFVYGSVKTTNKEFYATLNCYCNHVVFVFLNVTTSALRSTMSFLLSIRKYPILFLIERTNGRTFSFLPILYSSKKKKKRRQNFFFTNLP